MLAVRYLPTTYNVAVYHDDNDHCIRIIIYFFNYFPYSNIMPVNFQSLLHNLLDVKIHVCD